MVYVEILIVIILVVLNGLLAMSELAVVSSRPGRLRAMRERGVPGARTALGLIADPGRFLSTVQVGITLVGILAGTFSGASLGVRLAAVLTSFGLAPGYAQPLGFVVVVAAITYVSLVVGELVPKQVALRNPEAIACRVAVPMRWLSRLAAPFVWLLDGSGRLLIRLLGVRQTPAAAVTDEEIHALIAEAESAGVIESGERHLIAGVMRLGDRPVRAVMTPVHEVDKIGLADNAATLRTKIEASFHSRLVVHGETPDDLVGFVRAKDIANTLLARRKLDIGKLLRTAPAIPESMPALEAVDLFRDSVIHLAFVQDEYGRVLGIVTPTDLLETIAGSFAEDGDDEPEIVRREDGSWLVSGAMAVEDLARLIGLRLPERRQFETVAGLVLDGLKHLPGLGETVSIGRWRFEVVDLDGRRIDKVVASPLPGVHRPGNQDTAGKR